MGLDYVKQINKDDKAIYETINEYNKIPLHINKIELTGKEIESFIPVHWHRSIEIIAPIKGTGSSVWIEGEIYEVRNNECLIVNSKKLHFCEGIDSHTPYLGYALEIQYEFIKDILPQIDNIEFTYIKLNNEEEIVSILHHIIELYYSTIEMKELDIMSDLYHLFSLLFRFNSQLVYKENNNYKNKETFSQILSYINDHSDEDMSIEELADTFHLSYGYLAKLFKEIIHSKPLDYINYVRIKKIEKDILVSNDSISEICMNRGFNNTKSFYREFKKYHQESPSTYRKNLKKK